MSPPELRTLLDRVRGVRHACDLDLLLFFHRHPCALLTTEQLITYLGYERGQVAQSLDGLIESGLITRSQNPAHAARLYVLEFHSATGGLLSSLLKTAGTRQGRQSLMRLLDGGPNSGARARRRTPSRRSATVTKIA